MIEPLDFLQTEHFTFFEKISEDERIQGISLPLLHRFAESLEATFQKIYTPLKERISWIYTQKEQYRPLAEASMAKEPFFQTPTARIVSEASLLPTLHQGISGSYFLVDQNQTPCFVVKPIDEDCGCLHNPQGYQSFGMQSPVRENIELYQSALKEVLTYEIAETIGLASIAPKTTLALLKSDGFSFFFSKKFLCSGNNLDHFFSLNTQPILATLTKINYLFSEYLAELFGLWLEKKEIVMDKEKLCSVQTFVPNAEPLAFLSDALCKEEALIDPVQFEDCNILIWITGDTDAHSYNILAHPLSLDENGKQIYSITKIDNGLTFPSKNQGLRNALMYLPQINTPLSQQGKEKIQSIDFCQMKATMRSYGIEDGIAAMEERVLFLKLLAQEEGITLQEIGAVLKMLEREVIPLSLVTSWPIDHIISIATLEFM